MTTPSDIPASLAAAVTDGMVQGSRGPHINSGQDCTIYSRSEPVMVLWLPDDNEQEVVLQEGLEGEGEWLVAERADTEWVVTRDFWDDRSDESAQEQVVSGSRGEAVDFLVRRLLESPEDAG